jgi:hypothetical protein
MNRCERWGNQSVIRGMRAKMKRGQLLRAAQSFGSRAQICPAVPVLVAPARRRRRATPHDPTRVIRALTAVMRIARSGRPRFGQGLFRLMQRPAVRKIGRDRISLAVKFAGGKFLRYRLGNRPGGNEEEPNARPAGSPSAPVARATGRAIQADWGEWVIFERVARSLRRLTIQF